MKLVKIYRIVDFDPDINSQPPQDGLLWINRQSGTLYLSIKLSDNSIVWKKLKVSTITQGSTNETQNQSSSQQTSNTGSSQEGQETNQTEQTSSGKQTRTYSGRNAEDSTQKSDTYAV